jgi:hypothetical protein
LFDLTVSLMVLAAVVIGGRWGLAGVVLGALTVAAYDRVLVDVVSSVVPVDLHASSYFLFGAALYAAILLRVRSATGYRMSSPVVVVRSVPSGSLTRSEPSASAPSTTTSSSPSGSRSTNLRR